MNMLKLLPFAIATAVASGHLLANEQQNNSRFALAGYGDVKYEDSKLMDTSAFSARFVPIFLFSLNDKNTTSRYQNMVYLACSFLVVIISNWQCDIEL